MSDNADGLLWMFSVTSRLRGGATQETHNAFLWALQLQGLAPHNIHGVLVGTSTALNCNVTWIPNVNMVVLEDMNAKTAFYRILTVPEMLNILDERLWNVRQDLVQNLVAAFNLGEVNGNP